MECSSHAYLLAFFMLGRNNKWKKENENKNKEVRGREEKGREERAQLRPKSFIYDRKNCEKK